MMRFFKYRIIIINKFQEKKKKIEKIIKMNLVLVHSSQFANDPNTFLQNRR